jgi:hypothetical protein
VAWVRIDDHLYAHPKFRLAWNLEPASVGLELFALSHCAAFFTDGDVSEDFVGQWFATRRRLERSTDALVSSGLWVPNGNGWQIHDYLDYNDSKEVMVQRRKARETKRRRNREEFDASR